jgi:hypothetical protein
MMMKMAATEAPIDTNKISPSISHAELKTKNYIILMPAKLREDNSPIIKSCACTCLSSIRIKTTCATIIAM